jgi:hypothetical protein
MARKDSFLGAAEAQSFIAGEIDTMQKFTAKK